MSQVYQVLWTVSAKTLKSSAREVVSPAFDLSFSRRVPFKMFIRPSCGHEQRGGGFKQAKGKGTVEVRCLPSVSASEKPVVTFRIAVGSSGDDPARGPIHHDFSQRLICGLPAHQAEWDFTKHVDSESKTFVVCLEILSGATVAATAAARSAYSTQTAGPSP